MKNTAAFVALLLAAVPPSSVNALSLAEFYKLEPSAKVWYLGGVYDANVIQWNGKGERSACIEALGLEGFSRKLSEFVTALPTDPNAKERRAYDGMNVALLSALVLDKGCKK
jgi:hypothetical protein